MMLSEGSWASETPIAGHERSESAVTLDRNTHEAHRGCLPSPGASTSVGAATRLLGGSCRGSVVSGTNYWNAISAPQMYVVACGTPLLG